MSEAQKYQPYGGAGKIPVDCCDFSVVDKDSGKEVCRCWDLETAQHIAFSMNIRPTLSAAMELPEVRALLEAMERIAHAADIYGVEANAEDQGADTLAYAHKSTCNLARAALAPFTEAKP